MTAPKLHKKESTALETKTPLVARRPNQPSTIVRVGEIAFGEKKVILIGGPCAVENEKQEAVIALYHGKN